MVCEGKYAHFHTQIVHNISGRGMTLASNESLTEMSTRNISLGVKAAGAKAENLTTFMCQLS